MLKRFFAVFIALVIVVISFVGCSNDAIDEEIKPVEDFKVVAYIRGDYVQEENSLYAEDFDIITDVILFECASFNSEGKVNLDKEKLETALANIRKAIGGRNVKITLNLLGPRGTTESDVWEEQMEAQSDEHNKAFKSGALENNILAVLKEYDFDGVHFDYEYPISKKAWRHYNKFLVSLDEKLGDYTLGVAGVEWNIGYSKKAAKAIDSLELMAYDYNDSEGRHATYEDIINRIENTDFGGIDKAKINIGLPFYSRPTDMGAYWYGYNGYYEEIDEEGWYHCPETDKDFWFNTPEVIEKKTDYAINNGYGGVMVWHYNCDLPSTHEDSLFRAIGEAVK